MILQCAEQKKDASKTCMKVGMKNSNDFNNDFLEYIRSSPQPKYHYKDYKAPHYVINSAFSWSCNHWHVIV